MALFRTVPVARPPRVTASRSVLGIRWGRWRDRRCARSGHRVDTSVSVSVASGAFWPLCSRCGRGVEPEGWS